MIKKQEQDPRIRFGEWLDVTMRAHGYTSDLSLARELEIHHSTIGRWRKGDVPDLPQLRKLSHLFHVPLRILIVLAGHATSEEMEGAGWPTPEELDPIVRLIQKSPINDERKMKLLDEWYRRLRREQQIMEAEVQTDDKAYLSYTAIEEAQRNMYAHQLLDIVKGQILDEETDDEEEGKTQK